MKLLALILLFTISGWIPIEKGEIKLSISGTKTNTGIIRVLIFNQKEGFPDEPTKAFKAMSIPVKNFGAQATLKSLPSGNYAISVYHDEDENGVFKKNSLGIPIERYGFSNNPTLFFGPPSFIKCRVTIKDSPILVEINLK